MSATLLWLTLATKSIMNPKVRKTRTNKAIKANDEMCCFFRRYSNFVQVISLFTISFQQSGSSSSNNNNDGGVEYACSFNCCGASTTEPTCDAHTINSTGHMVNTVLILFTLTFSFLLIAVDYYSGYRFNSFVVYIGKSWPYVILHFDVEDTSEIRPKSW